MPQRNIQIFKFDGQEDIIRQVEFTGSTPDVHQWVEVALNKQKPVETIEMEGVEEDMAFDLMTKRLVVTRHKKTQRLDFNRDEKRNKPRK